MIPALHDKIYHVVPTTFDTYRWYLNDEITKFLVF